MLNNLTFKFLGNNLDYTYKNLNLFVMTKTELTEDQISRVGEINDLLLQVKGKIEKFYQATPTDSENKPDRELILYIRDKHSNPWRKQTEDIEGDVDEMRVIST